MRGALPAFVCVLAFLGGSASCAAPHAESTHERQTITRHFAPSDRDTGRYQYVAFDVPSGTGRLRVGYSYDKADGENVIDLGLFQPGPLDFATNAFRGYSGGAKSDVMIAGSEATPGYRAGVIPPGTWHALLGLYKVAPAGVDVTITVDAEIVAEQRRTIADHDQQRTSPTGPRWYKGALHTHTVHSDGSLTPTALIRRFRDADFDFVVITDHNNTTHSDDPGFWSELAVPRPLLLSGEEVTTPAGHANVWGLAPGEWIDFRVEKGSPRIEDVVAAAHARKALFAVNHPASACVGCGWEHLFVEGIDAIEISNGRHNEIERALAIWDDLLKAGRHITGVGSSDWHSDPNPIDVANSRVYATALTQQAILDGIRAGHVIVMPRGSDPTPDVDVVAGDRHAWPGDTVPRAHQIRVTITAPWLVNGKVVQIVNGVRQAPAAMSSGAAEAVLMNPQPGYIRFELFDATNTLVAVTNPVYISRP